MFHMKKVIIITYWALAVLLISLIVLSLGYTFSESLFIGAVFLPGVFFSIYFPERISRQGSVRDIIFAMSGTIVAEIFLILSAHFVILEMRNDFRFFHRYSILISRHHVFSQRILPYSTRRPIVPTCNLFQHPLPRFAKERYIACVFYLGQFS